MCSETFHFIHNLLLLVLTVHCYVPPDMPSHMVNWKLEVSRAQESFNE